MSFIREEIRITFETKPAIDRLKTEDVEVVSESDTGYSLQVSGNIGPLLHSLSNYSVTDVQITHANLEEVFLEFYK